MDEKKRGGEGRRRKRMRKWGEKGGKIREGGEGKGERGRGRRIREKRTGRE